MELRRLPTARRLEERAARVFLLASALVAVAMLAWLLARVALTGLPLVSWGFLTGFPSRLAARAGILPALVGSLWLGVLTLLFAVPVGVLAGVWLQEYARPGRFTTAVRIAIANLAGVPSVVFGLLGLALFVRFLGMGRILLAGALTLAILSLPVIVVATEEALKAIPRGIREAAYGLGATRWQVTRDHVLPYATPGILTGSILALARAVGETAPLIVVGGATAIFFLPNGPFSEFSALPLQTFHWAANPRADFRALAAAGTVVLLSLVLLMNAAAIVLRNRYGRRYRW